ncbi:putative inactive group IIC secretory phospholipase A2 isoform X2 [Equus przewalskii]|uniref:Phospholipase A2 n=2 Tax=Equus TaxID=9789 RepID=A0A9L0S2A6_HORSE
MKIIGVLVIFASCLIAPTHSSFWQFQRMVKHITGRSAFFSYYGYGCYCGLGGKGTPVDDTDRNIGAARLTRCLPVLIPNSGRKNPRGSLWKSCPSGCCLAHDCCYEKLKQLGCQPVLNTYQFHLVNGTVACECTLGPGVGCLCGLRACECDKRSAYCFKESLPTYEKNFKQFSSRPRCGRRKLQC